MKFIASKTKLPITTQTGFTVVELMVTVAIVVLITGIALVRYGSFNNSVLLKSQAYEVALDIRSAQTYGVSVSGQNSAEFTKAFGLYFDKSNTNEYVLFQDANNNLKYDSTPPEAIGSVYVIDPRFIISDIVTNSSGSCGEILSASVSFKRPNFDAHLDIDSGSPCSFTELGIVIASAHDPSFTRTVWVSTTGYVMVE